MADISISTASPTSNNHNFMDSRPKGLDGFLWRHIFKIVKQDEDSPATRIFGTVSLARLTRSNLVNQIIYERRTPMEFSYI